MRFATLILSALLLCSSAAYAQQPQRPSGLTVSLVNAQTGTSYTILTTDRQKLITFSNADAIAVTLPQAGNSFPNGFYFHVQNLGAGTVTITPTTSTIDGDTDVDIVTDQGVTIFSDGTNYFTQRGLGVVAEVDTLNTVFARTSGNRIDGATEAKPVEFRGSGGGADDGFDFFTDSSNVPQHVCVIGGVRNACDYYRLLADGKKGGYKDAAGNVEFEHTEDTGITAMTVDAETSGVSITIPEKKWFPFAACQNATASLLWNSPTSNAAAAACVTGTNTQKGVADFDATTDESLQMTYLLPSDWTGNIDARIRWHAAATSGAVGWCVQLISVADAETGDPAFPAQGAGNCVSDTTKGTTLQENDASISAVTATGVAAGEMLYIRVSRDADGGAVTDDMTGDARGIGLELTFRRAL